jgi:hypothetical protein
MRIALLSDIDAKRDAPDACRRHAWFRRVERLASPGDLTGDGAE